MRIKSRDYIAGRPSNDVHLDQKGFTPDDLIFLFQPFAHAPYVAGAGFKLAGLNCRGNLAERRRKQVLREGLGFGFYREEFVFVLGVVGFRRLFLSKKKKKKSRFGSVRWSIQACCSSLETSSISSHLLLPMIQDPSVPWSSEFCLPTQKIKNKTKKLNSI